MCLGENMQITNAHATHSTRMLATYGPIITRRRVKCGVKVLLIVGLLVAYVTVLLRESLQAMDATKRKEVVRQLAGEWKSKSLQSTTGLDATAGIGTTSTLKVASKKTAQTRRQQPRPQSAATSNPMYEYSAELNSATQADLQRRQTVLWEACARYDWIGKRPPNAWEFLLSPGHGLAWCNVFKAASSTWFYYFNILAGIDPALLVKTRKSPLELARKFFPRPTRAELEEAMQSSISFLVVREPFERLLSAYRDKLEGQRKKYYKKLAAQIVKRYRKSGYIGLPGPTFREFIEYVIDSHRKGETPDEHWRTVYEFCTPCSLNYTLIAKVETFRRDTEYIVRQAGLETLLLKKMPPHLGVKRVSNRAFRKTCSVVKSYYSQLDSDLLRDLLAIYEPDFVLFGYNSSKYQSIVKPVEVAVPVVALTTPPAPPAPKTV